MKINCFFLPRIFLENWCSILWKRLWPFLKFFSDFVKVFNSITTHHKWFLRAFPRGRKKNYLCPFLMVLRKFQLHMHVFSVSAILTVSNQHLYEEKNLPLQVKIYLQRHPSPNIYSMLKRKWPPLQYIGEVIFASTYCSMP